MTKEVTTPASYWAVHFRALSAATFSYTLSSSCMSRMSFCSPLQPYGCLCYTWQLTAILHAISAKFCFWKSSFVPSSKWCSTSMPQERYFSLLQQEDFLFENSVLTGAVYIIAANPIQSKQIKSNKFFFFLLSAMKCDQNKCCLENQ